MIYYAIYDIITKEVVRFVTVDTEHAAQLQCSSTQEFMVVDAVPMSSPDVTWAVVDGALEKRDRVKSIEEIRLTYDRAVTSHLNKEARLRGYDNINTACAYAAYPNPYQVESCKFITLRGAVWLTASELLKEYENSYPVIDPVDVFIAKLPTYK